MRATQMCLRLVVEAVLLCVFLTPRTVMGQTSFGSAYTGDVRSKLLYCGLSLHVLAFAPAR